MDAHGDAGMQRCSERDLAVENERVVWACVKKPEAVRQLVSIRGVNSGCGEREPSGHPNSSVFYLIKRKIKQKRIPYQESSLKHTFFYCTP